MGMVFDIQRLSVHDGPGIRTTVFLKGCPLRCKWCHNPESYKKQIQLQYIEEKCIHCKICQQVCKEGVHEFSNGEHHLNFDKCTGCGACVKECPSRALNFFGSEYTSEEVLDLVAKDEAFFQDEGGVTFSGGEVFLQTDFLYELLKGAKKRGFNTCIDTSGYTSWENFERVLPYTDTILYDIKTYDSASHIKATGVDNSIIWDNLEKLSNTKKPIYIRIPLIKEYNMDIGKIKLIAKTLGNLNIKGVTLMPYHTIGKSKRIQCGLEQSEVYTPPSEDEMKVIQDIFKSYGVLVI